MSLSLQKFDAVNKQGTVVIGLGETGISVAQYLSKQHVDFTMLDTRSNPPQLSSFKQRFPDIEIYLGEINPKVITQAAQIIVSPGININEGVLCDAAAAIDCECIGDIELFARSTTKPIAAITGSNGKSTVTSLVAEMARSAGLEAYAGGNLGPPALDLLGYENAELFVLELSSFQLESTRSLDPQVSVVLNISSDHLDRHGDIDSYARIKEHIYTNAKVSVINRDDVYVSKMKTFGDIISFGLGQPAYNEFGVINNAEGLFLAYGKKCLLPIRELALKGESGILNSLAALALGYALKLPMQSMLDKLKTYEGLPHRLALIAEYDGISWFDDSKGTNIGATISALRSLGENIILIAGGVFKGGDLSLLKDAVAKHAKHVVLLGQDARLMQQALEGVVPINTVNSMHDAVEVAYNTALTNDRVLLSPACASFDMYKNYIERGNDFENCVKGFLS